MPITAVIAEDEPILRAQLKAKLAKLWPALTIVADVGDGEAALEAIEAHRPSLAFLDIQMPEMTGIDVARSLAANGAMRTHIVFVTAFDHYAVQAFEAERGGLCSQALFRRAAADHGGPAPGTVHTTVPTPAQDLDALVAQLSALAAPGGRTPPVDQGQRGQPAAPDCHRRCAVFPVG